MSNRNPSSLLTHLPFPGVIVAIVIGLVGCGGGGSSSSSPGSVDTGSSSGTTQPPAATSNAVATEGTLDGFGSVYVDGTRYDTGQAEFREDGVAISEDDLDVGTYVRVEGSIDSDGATGVADRVFRLVETEGPIGAINLGAGSLVVLGRTVIVDRQTVFDDAILPADLSGLAVGDVVEISGLLAADGSVTASRIEPAVATDGFETRGLILDLDTGARTFSLGSITIDYGNAAIDPALAAALTDGILVRVKGTAAPVNGVWAVDRVEAGEDRFRLRDDGDEAGENARLKIRGLVTQALEGNRFELAGRPVRIDDATRIGDGGRAGLTLNTRVKVEGALDPDGVLLATEIELPEAVDFEIEGFVETLSPLEVSGFEVRFDDNTQFEDDSDVRIRRFRAGDLQIGDFVEVRGTLDASGTLVRARRIEREDEDNDGFDQPRLGQDTDSSPFDRRDDEEIDIEGTIETIDAGGISVRGFVADFDPATRYEVGDALVTAAEFLAVASVGDRVDLEFVRLADGSALVSEVEIEERELRGQVTAIDEAGVTVDGRAFTFDGATRFEFDDQRVSVANFLTRADVGDLLKVKFLTNGTSDPVVREISLEVDDGVQLDGSDDRFDDDDDERELRGQVTAIDEAGVTLDGRVFTFDGATRFEFDDQRVSVAGFLTRAGVGDLLKVEFLTNGAGDPIVREISFEERELRGQVTAIDEAGVTLDGRGFTFDGATRFEVDDQRVSVANFLTRADVGDLLKVEFLSNGAGDPVVREITLEVDDGVQLDGSDDRFDDDDDSDSDDDDDDDSDDDSDDDD